MAAAQGNTYLPLGITVTDEEKNKRWFVGSIDQGTTSTRFIIFDGSGNPIATHQMGFDNKHEHSGYEQDMCALLCPKANC
jgi:glycerol kinase